MALLLRCCFMPMSICQRASSYYRHALMRCLRLIIAACFYHDKGVSLYMPSAALRAMYVCRRRI